LRNPSQNTGKRYSPRLAQGHPQGR